MSDDTQSTSADSEFVRLLKEHHLAEEQVVQTRFLGGGYSPLLWELRSLLSGRMLRLRSERWPCPEVDLEDLPARPAPGLVAAAAADRLKFGGYPADPEFAEVCEFPEQVAHVPGGQQAAADGEFTADARAIHHGTIEPMAGDGAGVFGSQGAGGQTAAVVTAPAATTCEMRHGGKGHPTWTVRVSGGRLRVSGGDWDDSSMPVDIPIEDMETLLTHIRLAAHAARQAERLDAPTAPVLDAIPRPHLDALKRAAVQGVSGKPDPNVYPQNAAPAAGSTHDAEKLAPATVNAPCPVCEGGGWVERFSYRPPAFEVCRTCGNPEGHPCP